MRNYAVNAFKKVGSFLAYQAGKFVGELNGAVSYYTQPRKEFMSAKSFKETFGKPEEMTSYEKGYVAGKAPFISRL